MNFVFKMMNSSFKTMNSAFKTMDCDFKMMCSALNRPENTGRLPRLGKSGPMGGTHGHRSVFNGRILISYFEES